MDNYEVNLFKLVSGEEFIAQMLEYNEKGKYYRFAHPVQAINGEDGNMQFVPWVPMSETQEDFAIAFTHVMFVRPIPQALIDAHKNNFGSRIQVPDNKIILT